MVNSIGSYYSGWQAFGVDPPKEEEKTRKVFLHYTEAVAKLRVRRFWGLFWPLFDSNCGGNIKIRI